MAILSTATENSKIDELCDIMTNNSKFNKVMIGTEADGKKWYGFGEEYCCFYSKNYDALVIKYDEGTMHAANIRFLERAKMEGKEIYFSHDPRVTLTDYSGGAYAKELQWIEDAYGITEFTDLNVQWDSAAGAWHFVP